ncbi:hypothetical protein DMENIID0001_125570 [Sergentomyia squamirostris]
MVHFKFCFAEKVLPAEEEDDECDEKEDIDGIWYCQCCFKACQSLSALIHHKNRECHEQPTVKNFHTCPFIGCTYKTAKSFNMHRHITTFHREIMKQQIL